MAKFRGYSRVSGAQAGRSAVRVYVCQSCDLHQPHGGKPNTCIDCGGLAFYSFDSRGEAGRWATLCLLEKQGQISELVRQVRYGLMAARVLDGKTVAAKVGVYVADFTYKRDGEKIIEDYKGAITDLAAWKVRHMEAMGLPVKLTGG